MSVLESVIAWLALGAFFFAATFAPLIGIELSRELSVALLLPVPLLSVYFRIREIRRHRVYVMKE